MAAPLLFFAAYALGRSKLHWAPRTLRILKWIAISLSLALVVGAALFIGTLAYQLRNACDDMTTSPVVANSRGDRVEGHLQACTFIGTVENYYITLQIASQRRLWPEKRLIDYGPVDDSDPILRWENDNMLTVDLGKVYWVTPRLNQVGAIHVAYKYVMVDLPAYYRDAQEENRFGLVVTASSFHLPPGANL